MSKKVESKILLEENVKKQTKGPKKKSCLLKKCRASSELILEEVELNNFCPKKIFDIIFLAAVDEDTDKGLKKICSVAREYEELSSVTIIYKNEILELLNTFNDIQLPLFMSHIFQETCSLANRMLNEGKPLTSVLLADLTKLKLIQVMYNHYLKELDKMDKRKILEAELTELTRPGDQRRVIMKENLKETTNLSDRSNSINQTLRPIEDENEIIFDDDVFNHVWFYVIEGIYDPEVLQQLNQHFRVNIRAIVKIDKVDEVVKKMPYNNFWNTIDHYMDGPHRNESFEDTIQMKYVPHGEDYTEMFREFSYGLKNISEIKLKHVNYIRHMAILKEIHMPYIPLSCMSTYGLYLEDVPCELVNHMIILGGILEEVNSRFQSNIRQQSLTLGDKNVGDKISCPDPCAISTIFRNPLVPRMSMPVKKPVTFLAHENDLINIIMKSYKKSGTQACETLAHLLRTLLPVQIFDNLGDVQKDWVHKHDIEPSTNVDYKSENLQHFLYLYLFSLFDNNLSNNKSEEYQEEEEEEYLEVYDKSHLWQCCQIEIIEDGHVQKDSKVNLYDSFTMDYVWKENLPPKILLQKLVKAKEEFVYMQQKYCEETDTLLIQFSDLLDDFGMSTRIYENVIPTPVCLRDFCKYITAEKAEWLAANKPRHYVRKIEEVEDCPGSKKIIKQDIYKEYRDLLDARIRSEEDVKVQREDEENSVTFEEMLQDLIAYPPSNTLNEECSKEKSVFLGYDLGNKYFAVRGSKTTFVSHDNIKITVDNTRMLHEEPHCTAVIDFHKNSLVFHSNKIFLEQAYTFHANLDDDSVIVFILRNIKYKTQKVQIARNAVTPEMETKSNIIEGCGSNSLLEQDMSNIKKVISIDAEHLGEKLPNVVQENNSYMFQQLKESVIAGREIYKVNKNLQYLKRYVPHVEIPLTSILNRVLHKNIGKGSDSALFKQYIPRNSKSLRSQHNPVDFRISRPNGLYISSYPSKMKEAYMEIKQEFLERSSENDSVKNEEFRLFTREGFILIKKIDGTITLLKSSGDQINYEYPDTKDDDIRQSNLKFCHCKTINDYRKKLNRMFQNEQQDTYISRRAHLRTKKGYIINEDIMNIYRSTRTPYSKTTSIKFNGERISLRNNKVTEKQLYYTTLERDFNAQEIYYERTDGFQTLIDNCGTQTVRYADGTRISSTVHVSKKLVDGYVYVSLSFRYEHPCYATIIYSFDNSCDIHVNQSTVLRKNEDDRVLLNIDCDVAVHVSESNVKFEKGCSKCNLKFSCEVNPNPFYKRTLDYDDTMLHAKDTYNKQFYANFAGNCKRNTNYIYGHLNAAGCNHYNPNIYKKLFVMKRDFSGEYFWTDVMVQNRIDATGDWKSKEEPRKLNDDRTRSISFQKKIFKDYTKRFTNTEVLYDTINLSKYKVSLVPELYYTKFRNVKQMLTCNDTILYLSCLLASLERYILNNSVKRKVESLLETRRDIDATIMKTVLKSEAEKGTIDKELCKCVKTKLTAVEKMERWKKECNKYRSIIQKNHIPSYFESQFCKVYKK